MFDRMNYPIKFGMGEHYDTHPLVTLDTRHVVVKVSNRLT